MGSDGRSPLLDHQSPRPQRAGRRRMGGIVARAGGAAAAAPPLLARAGSGASAHAGALSVTAPPVRGGGGATAAPRAWSPRLNDDAYDEQAARCEEAEQREVRLLDAAGEASRRFASPSAVRRGSADAVSPSLTEQAQNELGVIAPPAWQRCVCCAHLACSIVCLYVCVACECVLCGARVPYKSRSVSGSHVVSCAGASFWVQGHMAMCLWR